MNFKILTSALTLTFFAAVCAEAAIKVACVGNSITEGYGIWDKKKYPEHLQDMLGSDYQVENFGHSSQMFRKNSGESYWKSDRFTKAYNFGADIVVIELGTNDSKYYYNGPENYYEKNVDRNEMLKDYEALIDTFAHQPQAPIIYATLQPYANKYDWYITDTAIVNQINPIIKEAAENKGAVLIDLHAEFNKKEWLLDDMVHPNETGAKELARIVANAIQKTPEQKSSSSKASEESSSSITSTSSSSEATATSSSNAPEDQSSSSSENAIKSSSSSATTTRIHELASTANFKTYTQDNAILIENYVGKISIFDLNGNLVKSAICNGSARIPVNRNGAYVVKAEK